MNEENKTCPVSCRRCGCVLKEEKRWLEGVRFNEFGRGVELDYRRLLTCPRLLTFFGFLNIFHDRREFNDDCTIEYRMNKY